MFVCNFVCVCACECACTFFDIGMFVRIYIFCVEWICLLVCSTCVCVCVCGCVCMCYVFYCADVTLCILLSYSLTLCVSGLCGRVVVCFAKYVVAGCGLDCASRHDKVM